MKTIENLIEEKVSQIKEQMKVIENIELAIEGLERDKDKRYEKIAHLRTDFYSLKRAQELMEVK